LKKVIPDTPEGQTPVHLRATNEFDKRRDDMQKRREKMEQRMREQKEKAEQK
jgi:hypothetical protein